MFYLIYFLLIITTGCTNTNIEKAHEMLQAGDFLAARKIYSAVLDRDAENFDAHYGMGMSLCAEAMYKMNLGTGESDDWIPAIYHMNIAANLQPNTPEVLRTLAILHFNLGTCHKREGNIDAAIERIENAITYDTTLIKAYNLLGALYHNKGDLHKAERYYTKVLQLQPEYAMAHFNLGAVSWALGEYSEAASHFEKASELSPGNSYFEQWWQKAKKRSG